VNVVEAMDALKLFTPRVPMEALNWIRTNWSEAEPLLLAVIDQKLKVPTQEVRDAQFLYAIHLCGEMRCEAAFSRYLVLCRLPNVVLDFVLGDILTEYLREMLARTCAGRTEELQALIEDPAVNEYARSAALDALISLFLDGKMTREWLSDYCISLLRDKLEKSPSYVWDAVSILSADIHADGAIPLIEQAFARGLADSSFEDMEGIQKIYGMPLDESLEKLEKFRFPLNSSENAMAFFVQQWGEKGDNQKDDCSEELLSILKWTREMLPPARGTTTGRNDPCPCGSGLKYKKCCLGKSTAETMDRSSAETEPATSRRRKVGDWMEAGYAYMENFQKEQAIQCWKACWNELRILLPPTLLDPDEAENVVGFIGPDAVSNWLEDFQMMLGDINDGSLYLLDYSAGYFQEVLGRFPLMNDVMRGHYQAELFRCLAMQGKPAEARALAERMIAESPNKAQGYVLLAEMCGEMAAEYNLKPDVPEAIRHFRLALERADDCEDYSVSTQLSFMESWQNELGVPL